VCAILLRPYRSGAVDCPAGESIIGPFWNTDGGSLRILLKTPAGFKLASQTARRTGASG